MCEQEEDSVEYMLHLCNVSRQLWDDVENWIVQLFLFFKHFYFPACRAITAMPMTSYNLQIYQVLQYKGIYVTRKLYK